tara:strand:- start:86 stop:649 length:564 start_codon:yes stop_codon:yes gene_type:complete
MSIEYPFGNDPVDESELLDWLTQAIHPGEYRAGGGQKTLAKNRIRTRIHRARKKDRESGYKRSRLTPNKKGRLNPKLFFEWAWEVHKWEDLHKVTNLPRSQTQAQSNLPPLQLSLGKISVVTVEDNYSDLKDSYLELVDENQILSSENEALRAENKRLRSELKTKRKKASQGRKHGLNAKGKKKESY